MQNYEIAEVLNLVAKLMELHGENTFKARSYQNAAFRIDKMKEPLSEMTIDQITATEGIGQSLSKKVYQLIHESKLSELETLIEKTPAGVMEMMQIKGIGPKKVAVLWKELGVENPGELLYACNENRLLSLKGFGAKTQEQIIKSIEFRNKSKGQYLYPDAEAVIHLLKDILCKKFNDIRVEETGDFRRRNEILTSIELIVAGDDADVIVNILNKEEWKCAKMKGERFTEIHGTAPSEIPFIIYLVNSMQFEAAWWLSTGSSAHLYMMQQHTGKTPDDFLNFQSENEIYSNAGVHAVIPEMREGLHSLIPSDQPHKEIITLENLQGILHNHSTWSDGLNTLEEMAIACRDLGYHYLGICDHSRSAVYAGGLTIERVIAQHHEIDALNIKMAPFRIFKGIESDILSDGSLDYPDEILATFDFVVASVHSGFKMDENRATERLIKAIRNPYTTILGHCTGRLLLAREGYPVNHHAVIDACEGEGVVLELNANPYRLDIDWRWIEYALEKNVMISINPDAHSIGGYHDLYYGVNAARKGGLPLKNTFNALSCEAIEHWFSSKRNRPVIV
jgi:DNA polymerase (family 10)